MTDTDNKPKKINASKLLRVAFVVSLAFNVLVVAVIAGGVLQGRRPAPMGGYDLSLGAFGSALSREDRGRIRDELRGNPSLRPPARASRQEAMQAFLAAVRADPFDAAPIQAIFDEQRERGTRAMQAGQDALLQRLSTMTSDERAAFADRAERSIYRRERDKD